MKNLILLLFTLILNNSYCNNNIVKLLVIKIITFEDEKGKVLYKVSDEDNLVTMFMLDSVNINLEINEFYCYYDYVKKKVLPNDLCDNTWINRHNKTDIGSFIAAMFEPAIFETKTDTIKCVSIKRVTNEKTNYLWKILTSDNKFEYTNKQYKIGDILYYTNDYGLLLNDLY